MRQIELKIDEVKYSAWRPPYENRFSIRGFSNFEAASLQGYLQDEDSLREVFDSDFCAACRSTADKLPEEVEDFDRQHCQCRVNSQTMVLRHCVLNLIQDLPQSPENMEILKQVQDDVMVTFHS